MAWCFDCGEQLPDDGARRCALCGGELAATSLVRPLTELAAELGIGYFVDRWLNSEGLLDPLVGDDAAAREIEAFGAQLRGFARAAAEHRARWLKPSLDPARLARAWSVVDGLDDAVTAWAALVEMEPIAVLAPAGEGRSRWFGGDGEVLSHPATVAGCVAAWVDASGMAEAESLLLRLCTSVGVPCPQSYGWYEPWIFSEGGVLRFSPLLSLFSARHGALSAPHGRMDDIGLTLLGMSVAAPMDRPATDPFAHVLALYALGYALDELEGDIPILIFDPSAAQP